MESVVTGWISPRVGVGFFRIGREAEAVRFIPAGILVGFALGAIDVASVVDDNAPDGAVDRWRIGIIHLPS